MLGHYAISSAPISGLRVSSALKLGASSVSATASTTTVAGKNVIASSANSAHLTTSQIPRRIKEVYEGLTVSGKAETSIIGLRKGISSVLSQGSATNTIITQKIAVASSANSASVTTTSALKRLRKATSQTSANVLSNTVANRSRSTSILVSSSANIDLVYLRNRIAEIGLSSSVNLDTISDLLWEALDKEVGNPSNITFTELNEATSSVNYNEEATSSVNWTEEATSSVNYNEEATSSVNWTELQTP